MVRAPRGAAPRTGCWRALASLDDAAAGHELWLLAEAGGPGTGDQKRSARRAHLPRLCLAAGGLPGGPAFLARWNAFMHRHGHHARGEIELFNPRWSECPDFVLDMVRGYVEAINAGHPSPIVRQEALAGERVALANRCIGGLKNPLKRAIFRLVLHRAQKAAGSGRISRAKRSGVLRFCAGSCWSWAGAWRRAGGWRMRTMSFFWKLRNYRAALCGTRGQICARSSPGGGRSTSKI